MTNSKEIRTQLKEKLNLNNRKVTVACYMGCTSQQFVLTVKHEENYVAVENFVKDLENLDRDVVTGEILEGGNEFYVVEKGW